MATFKDLQTFIDDVLIEDGYFDRIRLNPLGQFGTDSAPLLGASLMPQRLVPSNAYEEREIRYRTIMAQSGDRYSPAQLQDSGHLVGTFKVETGKADVASQMKADDYDALLRLLDSNQTMEAAAAAIDWVNKALIRPHDLLNEKQIWDAICTAQVDRLGANGYAETVTYPDPEGHRTSVQGGTVGNPAGWYETDGSYDPFSDLYAALDVLTDKGFTPVSCYAPRRLTNVLSRNSVVRQRTNSFTVIETDGTIRGAAGRATLAAVNDFLAQDDFPPITVYDRTWRTKTASGRMLSSTTSDFMVIVGNTERSEDIDLGDEEPIRLENTLGYYAIGTVAGQSTPGRYLNTEVTTRYPGNLYGEAIQEGLPVIYEPEAFVVLEIVRPTA